MNIEPESHFLISTCLDLSGRQMVQVGKCQKSDILFLIETVKNLFGFVSRLQPACSATVTS